MTTEKSTTELEEAYRKFLRLYERLAADRLTISKQGETLGKIIDELKAEAALATEFKVHVRQDVVETLRKTAAEISSQIKNSIQARRFARLGD
jgi:transcriptional regulator